MNGPKVNTTTVQKSLLVAVAVFLLVGCDEPRSPSLWVTLKAFAGDPEAKLEVARSSLQIAETTEQRVKGLAQLRQAADSGLAEAKALLASELLKTEENTPHSRAEAAQLLEQAEKLKPGSGSEVVGDLYIQEFLMGKDPNQAIEWIQKIARAGSPAALNLLGRIHGGGTDVVWIQVNRPFIGHSLQANKEQAVECFRKAAELNHVPSQRTMAWLLYTSGSQTAEDAVTAFQMALKAAENGDALAMTYLGLFYEIGYGVERNQQESFNWIQRAASTNDISARYQLADILLRGELSNPDVNQAVSLLEELSKQDKEPWWQATSKTRLGEALASFGGRTQDPQRAIQIWKQLAESDSRASYNLGWVYVAGSDGIQADINKAIHYFEMSASKVYQMWGQPVVAMHMLGMLYQHGMNGAPVDLGLARKWHEQASSRGHLDSKVCLGTLIARSERKEERTRGLALLNEAAEAGSIDAQLTLAGVYAAGRIVTQDLTRSNEWLRKACDGGSLQAAEHLAARFLTGNEGLPRDESQALRLLLRSAEGGRGTSQFRLASMYENGRGTARSFLEAYKWYLIAAANSQSAWAELAKMKADSLEQKMTKEQIAEGQKHAADFKPPSPFEEVIGFGVRKDSTASGTGFFITKSGHIATNAHVVANARQIRITYADRTMDATLVAIDQANDLAILKVGEPNEYAMSLIASGNVRLGETVATLGYPNTSMQGLSPKLAKGEIASLSGIQDDPRFFQISVPLQPGNSGGALFNEAGNVVGVVSNKLDVQTAVLATGYAPENVNYAVKSSLLLTLTESVPEVKNELVASKKVRGSFEEVVEQAEKSAVFIVVFR